MKQQCALIAGVDTAETSEIREMLEELDFTVLESISAGGAIEHAEKNDVSLLILSHGFSGDSAEQLSRRIRSLYYNRPLQIISIVDSWEDATPVVPGSYDDILRRPIDRKEMLLRCRIAAKRVSDSYAAHEERDFFRQAVKQEEELSSRVLDQNMDLKRAYQDIEMLNQELERVNRELQRMARYDALSGLMNRMSIFTMIDIEIERSLRTGSTLCGIMVDIDHFKDVNDTYGHQCGDVVIQMIGDSLKRELRKYDHAGRYGGEEFFILLPNTSLTSAKQFGDRFRNMIEQASIECGGAEVQVTASLGIAQYRPGESREMWISRADRALYAAKQRGRNRVETEAIIAL